MKKGKLPLHYLSQAPHFKRHWQRRLADLLAENGADIDLPNANKETPLYLAAKAGHAYIIENLVLDHGASLSLLDKNGKGPVSVAKREGLLLLFHFSSKDKDKIVLDDELKNRAIQAIKGIMRSHRYGDSLHETRVELGMTEFMRRLDSAERSRTCRELIGSSFDLDFACQVSSEENGRLSCDNGKVYNRREPSAVEKFGRYLLYGLSEEEQRQKKKPGKLARRTRKKRIPLNDETEEITDWCRRTAGVVGCSLKRASSIECVDDYVYTLSEEIDTSPRKGDSIEQDQDSSSDSELRNNGVLQ